MPLTDSDFEALQLKYTNKDDVKEAAAIYTVH